MATGGAPEEYTGEPIEVEGHLDLRDEGYGFLRIRGFLPSRDDVYVSVKQARQFGLRKGDHIKGASRPALRNEKNPALLRIDEVNGKDPEAGARAPALRGPHPAVPRRAPHDGAPVRPVEHDRPDHRPDRADREGPARPDRVAAEGRQDLGDEADRPLDRDQQPRGAPLRAARRRAARGGHRHAAVAEERRLPGGGLHLRPAHRGAHPRGRAHHRAGQATRGGRPRRRHHPRRHHPPVPGLQPGRARRPDG